MINRNSATARSLKVQTLNLDSTLDICEKCNYISPNCNDPTNFILVIPKSGQLVINNCKLSFWRNSLSKNTSEVLSCVLT